MQKPRIVIIEDELIIAETIGNYLNNLGYLVVAKLKTIKNAIQSLEQTEYDLALVDINIDGKEEGIELGHYFHQIKKPFIYLTSYSDPATLDKVKHTQPDAYIIKPFTQRDLFTNIELVLSRKKSTYIDEVKNRIKLNDGYKQVFVNVDDIMWIKADGVYLEIKTVDNIILQRCSFKHIMELFPRESMQRVHRSWAVNMKFVSELASTNLKIKDEIIPISKSYKKELQALMNK